MALLAAGKSRWRRREMELDKIVMMEVVASMVDKAFLRHH